MGKMKNAPVYFTVCQVQHNPLLTLGTYLPKIQEGMRKAGFPDFKKVVQVQLEMPMVLDSGNPRPPVPQQVERYVFTDLQGTSGFTLQPSALSFHTTAYDTFAAFTEKLMVGLTILEGEIGGLSFLDRLGLRYLDAVLPMKDESVAKYLAPELVGLPAKMSGARFMYSFAESLRIMDDNEQVVTRVVVQNGPLGFPADIQPDNVQVAERFRNVNGEHAIIDTDAFIAQRLAFDAKDVVRRLNVLHGLVSESFKATATDHAREVWGAEE